MKPGKLVIAVLAATVFLYLTDWLWYGMMMKDYYTPHTEQNAMPVMMWYVLGLLIFSFAFVSVYVKGVSGDTPVGEGARYGLWVTLLVFVPMNLIQFSMYNHAPMMEYFVDIVYHGIQMVILGIIVAYATGLPASRDDGKGGTGGDDAKQGTGGG